MDLDLVQLLNKHTRITENTATLLDNIKTSKEGIISSVNSKYIPEFGDHEM